jgi:hypothetical protein
MLVAGENQACSVGRDYSDDEKFTGKERKADLSCRRDSVR